MFPIAITALTDGDATEDSDSSDGDLVDEVDSDGHTAEQRLALLEEEIADRKLRKKERKAARAARYSRAAGVRWVKSAARRAARAERRAEMQRKLQDAQRVLQALSSSSADDDSDSRMDGLDSAIRMLGNKRYVFIGKTDLSKYFPSLPLHPRWQKFVTIKDPRCDTRWRGHGPPSAEWRAAQDARRQRKAPYRSHPTLPLGFKLAPAFASALSGEMIQFISSLGGCVSFKLRFTADATMYVDDMICADDTPDGCRRSMDIALSVFRWLGFKCNADKQEGPVGPGLPQTAMTYLGYLIDTEARTVTIDDDRRAELLRVARSLLASAVRTKDLETAIGKLGFSATVLRGARSRLFGLRRCLTAALHADSDTASLSATAHADAEWWVATLTNDTLMGSRIFLSDELLPVVTLKSDASGDKGWGYVHDGVLYWGTFTADAVTDTHIQYKELTAIVHAAEQHAADFTNKVVRFGCDNAAVCYAVNRLSSSCPDMMQLLRRLADAQCAHNFDCVACHVPRRFNDLADMCTRFQALAEFDNHLPLDVAVDPTVKRCRCSSPADSSPVFAVRLVSRAALASTTSPTKDTATK